MAWLRTLAAVAVTVVLWSSAFPGIRAALAGYSPGHMVLLRFLLASLGLGLFAVFARMPLPRGRDLPALLGLGFVGIGVYQAALTFGEQTVSSGAAALIVALTPIIMALLAAVLLGERLTAWGWLGSLIGFCGVALVSVGQRGGISFGAGAPLVLLAALATSIYFVAQKSFLRRYSALQVASCGLWAGTLVMLIFAPGLGDAVAQAPLSATLSVVYLALFPGMIAYVTWAYALSRASAAVLGNVIYLEPPLAYIIAFFWLGEIPTPLSLAGGAMTLVGVLIVNVWGRRPDRSADLHAS